MPLVALLELQPDFRRLGQEAALPPPGYAKIASCSSPRATFSMSTSSSPVLGATTDAARTTGAAPAAARVPTMRFRRSIFIVTPF